MPEAVEELAVAEVPVLGGKEAVERLPLEYSCSAKLLDRVTVVLSAILLADAGPN